MKKLIQNIKNLFKIYDLLNREAITLDLKSMGAKEGQWYCLNAVIKRENNTAIVDEILLFELKTKKQAKEKSQKMSAYYRLKE